MLHYKDALESCQYCRTASWLQIILTGSPDTVLLRYILHVILGLNFQLPHLWQKESTIIFCFMSRFEPDIVIYRHGQGCMNNFTFGDHNLGYYETISGGAGAGPTWHGRSGVHTHMTNTRITDPEVLEQRYPVVLRAFHLRHNSGGKGKWKGGDGVVRQVGVLCHWDVSIMFTDCAHQLNLFCFGCCKSKIVGN